MRVISKLDIKGKMVVKGLRYEGLRVVGSAADIASRYSHQDIDEIFYSDIVASLYGRSSLDEILKEVSEQVFIPITAGGGIKDLNSASRLILSGADKVAINTAAVENPFLIREIADSLGSQCVVSSIQTKINSYGKWEVFTESGRNRSEYLLEEWLDIVQEMGCGEIFINSVHNDGTLNGFDFQLASAVKGRVNCPLVIGGGISDLDPLINNEQLYFLSGISVGKLFHKNFSDKTINLQSKKKLLALKKPYSVGIIDYGMGNQTSLKNALIKIGCEVTISRETKDFNNCDCLFLPGVGNFSEAIKRIRNFNLFEFIKNKSLNNFPILGICLGMQLLYESSDEGTYSEGLGLVEGKVHSISSSKVNNLDREIVLPHIGWNRVLFKNDYCDLDSYFVHSFCPINNNDDDIIASCEYSSIKFTCGTRVRKTVGLQFHPEISGYGGLNLLVNILNDLI